ncbi:MAG: right-handed parallel beta-helix repeat-containing protein [Chloroflexi bacterium]|nr:right-handed parallel beta-helix repeat-containing protein [Chloroflexota bacterium]
MLAVAWGLPVVTSAPRAALAAPAALLVVDNNGDIGGQLCTAAASDCSLRSAVQIANLTPGSTIAFDNDYTITLGSSLFLSGSFTTISNLGVRTIRVDANGAGQAFVITGSDVQIDGLNVYGAPPGSSNIYITGSAVRVIIRHSNIGHLLDGGSCAFTSSYGGIYIDSTGGSLAASDARVWIYANNILCINGTPGDGITLAGTNRVVIGEDEAGNASGAQNTFIGKNNRGVVMTSGAQNNRLRNSGVNGNGQIGLLITGGASYNIVSDSQFGNQLGNGIQIDGGAQSNLIGNDTGQPRTRGNWLFSNSGHGIYISGSATQMNVVQGNNIGTNAAGTAANPNTQHGIVLDNGAAYNYIGFGGEYRNLISGNTQNGVEILNGAQHNLVRGNYIGTNISGTLAIPNLSGVTIYNGAQYNEIGGTISGTQNLVSGNTAFGIYIAGSNTATNTITSNSLGYDRLAGRQLPPNGWDNIMLSDHTHGNIIGGWFTPNAIEYAAGNGITVEAGAQSNQILMNFVSGNSRYGVLFDGSSTASNVISRTSITYNGQTCPGCDGIAERNSAGPNRWTEVSIFANAGLGIDRFVTSDTTNTINPPYLYITGVDPGTGVVSGTADGSGLFALTTVELYRVAVDPSGYGEGIEFVGRANTDANGNWSITDGASASNAPCYTAFTTETFLVFLGSSEFSRSNCSLSLPLIRR